MKKKAKVLTDKQLRRRIRAIRWLMSAISSNSLKKRETYIGKELYLNTDEGKVRVLGYNLENKEKLPLFVNLHSSGFSMGNAEMDDPFMINVATNANVKILCVDYSLAPESPFPKALNECYAVIKYAKENPDELGIDADRIAVGGHSAGGNISAAICLMDNERKLLNIKCSILDYPPMDLYKDCSLKIRPKGSLPVFMCQTFHECYLNDKEARKNPLVSPLFASIDQLRSFPPTLIITASNDLLFTEAEEFRDKLLEADIKVTHKRFNAIHGFNLKHGGIADESWQMMIDHLNKYL